MKLKKIASLALAGIMAVSMLAGCGDKTGNTTTEVTNTNAVVTAANDMQSNTNKVKVTFTAGDSLEKALKAVFEQYGDNAPLTDPTLTTAFRYASGLPATNDVLYTGNVNAAGKADTSKNGVVQKNQLYVAALGATNEEAAVKMAGNMIDTTIADLNAKETTKNDKTTVGDDVYTYTYTGEVALAPHTTSDGLTIYYLAYTIHQNGVKTVWGK